VSNIFTAHCITIVKYVVYWGTRSLIHPGILNYKAKIVPVNCVLFTGVKFSYFICTIDCARSLNSVPNAVGYSPDLEKKILKNLKLNVGRCTPNS